MSTPNKVWTNPYFFSGGFTVKWDKVPEYMHLPGCLEKPREDAPVRYKELGLLCVEMETAGLYIEAQTSHQKAVSILSVSDTFFTGEALSADEREKSFTDRMEVSLETALNYA